MSDRSKRNIIPSIADIFGLEFIFYLLKNMYAALINILLLTMGQNIVFFYEKCIALGDKAT